MEERNCGRRVNLAESAMGKESVLEGRARFDVHLTLALGKVGDS
jgi:hypothetical protein